jgi:hypothetical protein
MGTHVSKGRSVVPSSSAQRRADAVLRMDLLRMERQSEQRELEALELRHLMARVLTDDPDAQRELRDLSVEELGIRCQRAIDLRRGAEDARATDMQWRSRARTMHFMATQDALRWDVLARATSTTAALSRAVWNLLGEWDRDHPTGPVLAVCPACGAVRQIDAAGKGGVMLCAACEVRHPTQWEKP